MALTSMARWAVLGALFLIPFLPLYVANGMFFPFISSKGFAFRILVELAMGAWLLLALADKRYRPRFSWTFILYGGFIAWMFIADLFAVNAHKAFWSNYERMDGWVTLIHVFLFFVIAGSVLSVHKLWKRWWLTVLGASVLVSLHGLWQIFGLTPIHQGGARVDANFGNAIYLAVYLMFTILIALWQALESKGFLRWSLIALAALQLVLLFFTATRGVMLGLFGALVLMSLAWAATAGGKGRSMAVAAFITLCLLAGGFYLARDSAFVKSEPALARLASVFDSNELKVRGTLWGMALQGAVERPITGWGQEGYNFVFNKYYQPSLYAQESWFDRAHNEYLDWLVAGGFPALLLFLAALLSAVWALFKSDAPRPTRIFLAGALVGYALQAVTAFDNLMSYVLAAALFAMAHDYSSRPWKRLEEAPVADSTTLATIGAPFALVITVAALWLVNVPGIQAGGDLIRAASSSDKAAVLSAMKDAASRGSFATQEIREQLLLGAGGFAQDTNIPMDLRQAAVTLAFGEIQKELTAVPGDARIHLMYAQALRLAGDAENSMKELDAALALSPKKQGIILQKGSAEWEAGNKAAALALFETAYELDTSNKLAAAYVAAGRIVNGDVAGGKTLLMEAYGTASPDVDVLRAAYFDTQRYDDLVEVVKARVAANPGDAQAHFQLAQAYVLAGRMNEAKAEIQATAAAHPETAAAAAAYLTQLGL